MTRAKTIQAKHIPDVDLLRAVRDLSFEDDRTPWPWPNLPHWVTIWDLDPKFPGIPPKVIVAKCASLIKRGLLDGCTCGCRGDLELTEHGEALLDA